MFGRRLRKVRNAARWTQAHAAGVVGVSEKTWRCWESEKDESLPRIDQVAAFCIASGANPVWLLLGEGEMFREASAPDLATRLAALPPAPREALLTLLEALEAKGQDHAESQD